MTLFWIALGAVALLWPSRLAGPLDGMPLDGRAEALLIGLVLPVLVAFRPAVARHTTLRACIVALLAWKGLLTAAAVPDGWCVRYESEAPLFIGDVRVPHAWDVRADWQSDVPSCSAIMTRPYRSTFEFPTWFFNLPPANLEHPAEEHERPPYATMSVRVSGFVAHRDSGVLRVDASDDVRLVTSIDGQRVEPSALATGVTLPGGSHQVVMEGIISGEQWRLVPTFNGAPVFESAIATRQQAGAADHWLRPLGRWVGPLLILAMLATVARSALLSVRDSLVIATVSTLAALPVLAAGRLVAMRVFPLLLALAAIVTVPRRLQNLAGARLLIGLPFIALIGAIGFAAIGRVTWYTIGDDWWVFQRFAYRIYLQGYWLEGGEVAFWFQPFYRWIAGALHMVFGDSSVGELFWDGACVLTGSLFAFHVSRHAGGFRWGAIAAVVTLLLHTAGPGWYLFGRGLSEITSAGLTYGAALLVLRGRHGKAAPLVIAGVCLALAFYTRLNNLLFVAAVSAFSLPLRQHAGGWWRWRDWSPRVSRPAFVAVVAAIALAIALFSARSFYLTGNPNPLSGTQAGARSVWQTTDEGLTPAQNLAGSLLMVISMSDPPSWEPRAIPIVAGIVASILGLAGVGRFKQLPLNVSVLRLAGVAGAFVARGSAYPGRFSIHLLPVTVALTISAIALWVDRGRGQRTS